MKEHTDQLDLNHTKKCYEEIGKEDKEEINISDSQHTRYAEH